MKRRKLTHVKLRLNDATAEALTAMAQTMKVSRSALATTLLDLQLWQMHYRTRPKPPAVQHVPSVTRARE